MQRMIRQDNNKYVTQTKQETHVQQFYSILEH